MKLFIAQYLPVGKLIKNEMIYIILYKLAKRSH